MSLSGCFLFLPSSRLSPAGDRTTDYSQFILTNIQGVIFLPYQSNSQTTESLLAAGSDVVVIGFQINNNYLSAADIILDSASIKVNGVLSEAISFCETFSTAPLIIKYSMLGEIYHALAPVPKHLVWPQSYYSLCKVLQLLAFKNSHTPILGESVI